MPKKLKIKMIFSYDLQEFENKLNDFIKDIDLKDIKFSSFINPHEKVNDKVGFDIGKFTLVMYNE